MIFIVKALWKVHLLQWPPMRTTSYIHAFLFDYVCVAEPPIHSMHCKTLFNILQKENQQTRQRTCMPFIFWDLKKGKESLFLPTRPCGTNRDELSHEKPHAKCMHLWSKIIDSSCLTVIIPSSLQTHFKFKNTFLQCLPRLNSSSGPHFPVCYESVPSDPWCGLVVFCVMAFC